MTTAWEPAQYLRFASERERPFSDLLARIPLEAPATIVDLGCGPGTTTVTLLDRWPGAHITGIDSSAEMIDSARALEVPGRLSFARGDVREWSPPRPVDLVLSCATLQWVPGHVELLPRFVDALAPGGVFAFQIPGNFDQPSHVILHQLAGSERWKALVGQALPDGARSFEPAVYIEALLATGAEVEAWETTYFHTLIGPDPVFEWMKGTGLRPVLAALADVAREDREDFLDDYRLALRRAYPSDERGRTIFPFRRIFSVARAPTD